MRGILVKHTHKYLPICVFDANELEMTDTEDEEEANRIDERIKQIHSIRFESAGRNIKESFILMMIQSLRMNWIKR